MNQVKNRNFNYNIPEKNQLVQIENQNFQYYFLVLEEEIQNPALKSLLDKILAALPVKLNDNAQLLTLTEGQYFNLSMLPQDKPTTLVSFGLDAQTLCIQTEETKNKLLKIDDLKLLMVERLGRYDNDQLKKVLWAQLKSLFELN